MGTILHDLAYLVFLVRCWWWWGGGGVSGGKCLRIVTCTYEWPSSILRGWLAMGVSPILLIRFIVLCVYGYGFAERASNVRNGFGSALLW